MQLFDGDQNTSLVAVAFLAAPVKFLLCTWMMSRGWLTHLKRLSRLKTLIIRTGLKSGVGGRSGGAGLGRVGGRRGGSAGGGGVAGEGGRGDGGGGAESTTRTAAVKSA